MREKTGKARSGRSCFRSVDEWKSALMTLPDSNFFELVRSVFGNIKTPFNKQRLLEDLANLLSREEIRNVIAAYIGEQDHKLIAAVALLGEPSFGSVAPGILETFFAGEFSYAELHAIIINLEERLILYRFKDEGVMRLSLNPVLEEVLAPFIEDTRPIIPSYEIHNSAGIQNSPERANAGADAVSFGKMNDSRYMAALFSFIQGEEELFKTEAAAGIRKKVLDEWKKIFPRLDLNLAVQTLLQLGLFRIESRSLAPNQEKIADFCALSAAERLEYWAAGMYLCISTAAEPAEGAERPAGASRMKLRAIASFIHRFRTCIETGRCYPETTLRRLELLFEKDNGASRAWGYPLFDFSVKLQFEQLLKVMENAGLLEKEKTHWRLPPASADIAPNGTRPVLAMDSAFSILLYPEISFADALTLGSFCSVKENDSVVRFELSRESAVLGFDRGMKAADITEFLDRLSGGRIDESLGWTLREWETRYEGVALHQGIVLRLAEDRLYLAEAEPLSSLIERTLAPGVFLLSCREKTEAAKALRKAGVDIIARPPETAAYRLPASRDAFPRLGTTVTSGTKISIRNKTSPKKSGGAEFYLEGFRRTLEKMKLGKQEKEELSARIERRLVLSEAQMEATSLRYEKTEARLLDYRGKAAVAKDAIDSGSLVEVIWTETTRVPGDGRQKQFTGIAQALEKKEGDSILVIKDGKDGAKSVRIPLGKISLLRRIKKSIFGG